MHSIKLISARLVLTVALAGAILLPSAAQANAALSGMRVSSHVFPSGVPLTAGMSGAALVAGGSKVILNAPQYVYQAPVPPATTGTIYEFMFWDADRTLITTTHAAFAAPSATVFAATAWYLPTGGGPCSGPCPTSVTTWAFNLTTYRVVPATPIKSVSPSTAWTAPSRSVSTATGVTIIAKPYLGLLPPSKYTGTPFSSWFVFGGGSSTVSGSSLTVPAGQSPYAIAFYRSYSLPRPPPCIGFPYCI